LKGASKKPTNKEKEINDPFKEIKKNVSNTGIFYSFYQNPFKFKQEHKFVIF